LDAAKVVIIAGMLLEE